jgi:AraC family L-rhamnose operon transcriptional activator RhaR
MPERLRWKQFFPADPVPIQVTHWLRNEPYQAHDHEFMEIVVIVAGEGLHRTTAGDQRVKAGTSIILRPGAWHAYRDCRGLEAYDCCFGVELLRRELAWVMEDPALDWLFWAGPLGSARHGVISLRLADAALAACRQHLDALRQTAGDSPRSRPERIGRLLLLLGELAGQLAADRRPTAAKAQRAHPAVLEGVRLLEDDPARSWTLAELAGALHLEATYLVRLFRAVTGLPPMAYLARCRAERAAALLARTDLPVGEIGARVGWLDANYFARRFRAHFGITASEYRGRFGQGAETAGES